MQQDQPPLSREDLIAALAAGEKPREHWRIGTEHEKFVFHRDTLAPALFDGERGIERLLVRLEGFGWEPKREAGRVIALYRPDGASITLEPGGQLELSGAPLRSLHETCREINGHLNQIRAVGDELDLGYLGLGFHPLARLDEIPPVPKARYRIMRAYMPKKGAHGLDMMFRTATVQVNLDFSDERDMVRKMRVAMALQPLATALFANSPFVEGRPCGYLSYRSFVWMDTDPDRTGILAFVFEDGFGYERYVDWVLDAPMYFVERDGVFHDVAGASFRDFMAGRLARLPGVRAGMKDWEDHLTTVFPEVRLKTFLEMRGADGGPWARLCALPAFWVGLLYDEAALAAAEALVRSWPVAEILSLREQVPKGALATPFQGRPVRDWLKDVLSIARDGLKARGMRNEKGEDETGFLDTLDEIVTEGRTLAEQLLAAYETRWKQDVRPVFVEQAY
ncbi:MAG: glutamate--cysteine ligase [Alphaproteobacteria bacterium]|nr:MAG: glutamate--cysteine ligase [Alphaproteobacteria bacterium]